MRKYLKIIYPVAVVCIMTTHAVYADETSSPKVEMEGAITEIQPVLDKVNLDIGVILELSGAYTKQGDKKTTDMNLDNLEIDLSADVSDSISFSAALLYEDGEDFGIDSAWMEIGLPQIDELSLVAGLIYMPFGVFAGDMVSDPLTLELGEVSENTLGIKYSRDLFELSIYAFTGEIDDDQDDVNGLVAICITPMKGLSLSASYISDLGEASYVDNVNEALEADENAYESAGGVNVALMYEGDGLYLAAEYLAATGDMRIGDETFRPRTWSVDAGFNLTEKFLFAGRYEGCRAFRPDEMPESQFGGTLSYVIDQFATLSCEYLYGKFENIEDLDDRHMITAKLSLEF